MSLVSGDSSRQDSPELPTLGKNKRSNYKADAWFRSRGLTDSRIETNVLLPVFDFLVFIGCFATFFALRTGQATAVGLEWERLIPAFAYFCAIFVTVWVMGGYRAPAGFRRLSFAAEYFLAIAIGSLVGLFVVYAILTRSPLVLTESRSAYLLSSVAFAPVGLWFRILLARKTATTDQDHPYLVIGNGDSIEEFARAYLKLPLENPLVFLPTELKRPLEMEEFGRWADPTELHRSDLPLAYQAVVVCSPFSELPPAILERLVEVHFRLIPVINLAGFYSLHWRQVPLANLDLAWALEQDFSLAERSYYRYLKGLFDRLSAIAGILCLWPLMLLIGLIVKLQDGGPVFFCQPRVGRGRRTFTIYKFRTMQSSGDGSRYTAKNDPRVTPFGRLLRLTRLDELPQLLNILKGEMSLIGPRAEWTILVEEYERKIPAYHLRHMVKPGLTGWAQLNYPYGASLEDAAKKLAYDLYYLKYYSPILDVEIILKTLLSLVSFRGR